MAAPGSSRRDPVPPNMDFNRIPHNPPSSSMNGGPPPSGGQTHAPARPMRSVRRPTQAPHGDGRESPRPTMDRPEQQPARSNGGGAAGGPGPMSRAARLQQAIMRDEAREGNGSRPGTSHSHRGDESPTGSGDEEDLTAPQVVKPVVESSPVLEKAVAAFSSRDGRGRAGTAASSGKPSSSAQAGRDGSAGGAGRSRRGAVGVQGESARFRGTTHQEVPETPAFREMERVLAQVASDWPEVVPQSTVDEPEDEAEAAKSTFDPVTLALSLVDSQAPPERMHSFLETKEALSRSLKSSIQTHYRAFDASVSSYNGVLANLTGAQRTTSKLRTSLEDVREILGKSRSELGVLHARKTELEEMDRILGTIETLRNVPDKLESLMSEKRFFQASVLLVRSLKMIQRQEILEVAATGDLRSYFQSQETLMLEFLTEELHAHLYLKSYYCDTRWKAHQPGQTDLPDFFVERAAPSIFDFDALSTTTSASTTTNGADPSSSRGSPSSPPPAPTAQTKLSAYLQALSQKPASGPSSDYKIDEAAPLESLLNQDNDSHMNSVGMVHSSSGTGSDIIAGLGLSSSTTTGSGPFGRTDARSGNPENDSFAYIESILESLAHLGKLSVALDSVLQRTPLEVYNLVESTVLEVDERSNDPTRRNSLRLAGASPKMLYAGTFSSASSQQAAYSLLLRSSASLSSGSEKEDARAQATLVEMNTEVLLDLFWTVFSKFDAVLQGFRVLNEVVNRITSRRDFKDSASKSGNLLFSLSDAWKPVQTEVQALLHDYLVDEQAEGGGSGTMTSAGRNSVVSINDTLRMGKSAKDSSKPLFRFTDSDGKSSSRKIKPYEDSLNRSLKASVPGLVSSLAEGTPGGLSGNSLGGTSLMALSPTSNGYIGAGPTHQNGKKVPVLGRTHRMLVPPNAFKLDQLALPALKFVERVQATVPDALAAASGGTQRQLQSQREARRLAGLLDDDSAERLGPAIEAWLNKRNRTLSQPAAVAAGPHDAQMNGTS